MLPPSNQANEADIVQTGKKVIIEELGSLHPDLNKNDTFLCKVSIKRYNTRYEWWYKMFLVLEDEMNEINALIIGKSGEKVGMACTDLVFNQRLADQKQLPNLSIQPTTPQSISREIAISSTTISSSTAPIETTGESHKRKGELISEADVQDFDQVPIKLLKKKKQFSLTSSKTDPAAQKKKN
ncbi:replication protein A 70 kDa DNA-binding subunit C-like [Pyrus ussuriensis x Pyrus communis]|uniref:Replication protein A 70 kDa DNA-binding subunit C-like n=1 Tax=Pyrus ussuriensis x Pyrus communis TaxID=2448454 RepID=A0A5N5ICA7_9ROSA|nr:replication protein A 70 kDa DNA-binding subunit C-like [Pyrus ussuriensis x Pyrus communis]